MTKDKNPEPNDPDDLWLQVLRGTQINFRPGSDLKNDESYLKVKEAEILRKKILHKIENENKFETSSSAYQKILDEAKSRKLLKDSKKTWTWFGLTGGGGFSISGGGLVSPTYAIASIVLIVGLVAIVGYQSLELRKMNSRTVPSEIFRGVGNQQEVKKFEGEISSEVTIKSATPLTQVNTIINSALDSKLVAEVKQIDGGYQVIIHGMSSMNKDEVALKSILGISNRLEGSIRVVIKTE